MTLRDRTRARRRAAVERAAMRLFAERGYDATTVAQIADEAEVSPRTVSMYFPSKLDLAMAYSSAASQRLAARVVTRGAGEPLLEIMLRWLEDEFRNHREELALQRAMLEVNPALRGTETADVAEAKQLVTAALAADLDRPPSDPVVVLVAGAVEGLVAALVQMDAASDDAAGFEVGARLLRAVLRTAHAEVRAGGRAAGKASG
jgi:AcrR family transcriptional regulator